MLCFLLIILLDWFCLVGMIHWLCDLQYFHFCFRILGILQMEQIGRSYFSEKRKLEVEKFKYAIVEYIYYYY